MLLPNLSIIKIIDTSDWSPKDLRLMLSGGNSTLREFMTYYDIDPDTPINIKYRYRALDFYRSMLGVISDRKLYDMPFLSKFEGRQNLAEEYNEETQRIIAENQG